MFLENRCCTELVIKIALITSVNDSPWQLVHKGKSHGKVTGISNLFIFAKGSISVNNKKHTQIPIVIGSEPKAKRARISQGLSIIPSPLGLTWDGDDYSCGYDSLLVILFDIWKDNPAVWSDVFRGMNRHCALLSQGFDNILKGTRTFEQVRDNWRTVLHTADPVMFPTGTHGTIVADLAKELLKVRESIASSQHQCSSCEYVDNPIDYISRSSRQFN